MSTGNFGLKDQQMALRWLRANIRAFGGDPDVITLAGESAGAASVGFHMLSSGSINLFRRAIMQSGSPNGNWAFSAAATVRHHTSRFLRDVGCHEGDSRVSGHMYLSL